MPAVTDADINGDKPIKVDGLFGADKINDTRYRELKYRTVTPRPKKKEKKC